MTSKRGKRKMKVSRFTTLFIQPFQETNNKMTSPMNGEQEKQYYEEVKVTLRMHKNIARLLRIFANIHKDKGSTEYRRINNFCSEEIIQTVKALAAEPLPDTYPDSLKEWIQKLLKETNSRVEDLK